ncbi:MAG: hypothetical protein QG608_1439 [Actinomycetota bacterium]|nr:hypothetical protein [Actinomycetota bacterium]
MVSGGLREVYRATGADWEPVCRVIALAFEEIEVSRWLCPEEGQRVGMLARFVGLLTAHALDHGTVEYLPGHWGAAVWLPEPCPPIPDYPARLRDCAGPYLDRFQALDAAMEATHPVARPHSYLAFLAVCPSVQGQGLGSLLLRRRLAFLDATGTPSYLEAADERSRRLYARNGYVDCAPPLDLPVRQSLMPMWREPVREPGRSLLMS